MHTQRFSRGLIKQKTGVEESVRQRNFFRVVNNTIRIGRIVRKRNFVSYSGLVKKVIRIGGES